MVSVDLCEGEFFARLMRDKDVVTVRLLLTGAADEPRVVAEFRCGLGELGSVLAGCTLQLANREGDFLLASPDPGGVTVAFTSKSQGRSRACRAPRDIFAKLLSNPST